MDSKITIIRQEEIVFQGDEITAVLAELLNVETGEIEEGVYVPLRPICELIGVDWAGQRRRVNGDPVLANEVTSIDIVYFSQDHNSTQTISTICLPLKLLNGFLFGINANRVKVGIRDKLIAYQKDCYDVLHKAFQSEDKNHPLQAVRDMALAIAQMAAEQIEYDRRIAKNTSRLEAAAHVVRNINNRLTRVERRVTSGQPISDEQASEIKETVKAIAFASDGNYQRVWNELYKRFGATSYKLIQARDYAAVMVFLNEWRTNNE